MNTAPPCPLPNGHYYGPRNRDLRCHTGKDRWDDNMKLAEWQDAYNRHWDGELDCGGCFDGPTQRAAIRIQQEYGLPVTGMVDVDTWERAWHGPPGVSDNTQADEQPPEGASAHPLPSWWSQGLEQGVSGEAVMLLQERFGLKTTARYNRALAEAVRGFQNAHGLDTTGAMDEDTAKALGELP